MVASLLACAGEPTSETAHPNFGNSSQTMGLQPHLRSGAF